MTEGTLFDGRLQVGGFKLPGLCQLISTRPEQDIWFLNEERALSYRRASTKILIPTHRLTTQEIQDLAVSLGLREDRYDVAFLEDTIEGVSFATFIAILKPRVQPCL